MTRTKKKRAPWRDKDPGKPRTVIAPSSGYVSCACRDCFELAIGEPGAMCHACNDAGCEPNSECQAPGAYGGMDGV